MYLYVEYSWLVKSDFLSEWHAYAPSSHLRPSIPVDPAEVKLEYDVTTYESKLGDPKPEEPTIQSPRRPIEPEKIKKPQEKHKVSFALRLLFSAQV